MQFVKPSIQLVAKIVKMENGLTPPKPNLYILPEVGSKLHHNTKLNLLFYTSDVVINFVWPRESSSAGMFGLLTSQSPRCGHQSSKKSSGGGVVGVSAQIPDGPFL